MDQRDDLRTEGLSSLRLALATFALQLDAFEAGLKSRLPTNPEPLEPHARDQRRKRKGNDLLTIAASDSALNLIGPNRHATLGVP
jgi:hypothetical protein